MDPFCNIPWFRSSFKRRVKHCEANVWWRVTNQLSSKWPLSQTGSSLTNQDETRFTRRGPYRRIDIHACRSRTAAVARGWCLFGVYYGRARARIYRIMGTIEKVNRGKKPKRIRRLGENPCKFDDFYEDWTRIPPSANPLFSMVYSLIVHCVLYVY